MKILKTIYKEYTMLITLVVLVLLTWAIEPTFMRTANIMNIFRQSAVVGCVALGVGLVWMSGTFDMSVGATLSLCGILALKLQNSIGVAGAILVALLVGTVIGAVNGLIITGIKGGGGESFMVTYGTMNVVQAIALMVTDGNNVSGSNNAFYRYLGNGDIGVIPFSIIMFAVLAVLVYVFITKSYLGRNIYYTGSNTEVARLSGINIKFSRIFAYSFAGLMAAVGALILTARSNGALPKSGAGYEFDVATAVAVGGVGVGGGSGSVGHIVIGVLIMGVISNAMNMIGISSQNQLVVKGLLLVLAVILDTYKKKKMA